MHVEALFGKLDDFEQEYEVKQKEQPVYGVKITRNRKAGLSRSEIMTILILCQQSGFRHLKGFYTKYVCLHLRTKFPGLFSYKGNIKRSRFAIESHQFENATNYVNVYIVAKNTH